jgi:hypothetical protein
MKHLPHTSGSQLPNYAASSSHWPSKEHDANGYSFRHRKDAKHDQSEPASNDPPPAYSASADVDIPDDALALLSRYDTVFLVDDSLSMIQADKSGFLLWSRGKTRWELVRPDSFRILAAP